MHDCDSSRDSKVLKLNIVHEAEERFSGQRLPWEGTWGIFRTAVQCLQMNERVSQHLDNLQESPLWSLAAGSGNILHRILLQGFEDLDLHESSYRKKVVL